MLNHSFCDWNTYTVSELKTAGIAFDFGPLKLKAGYGEVVLFALQALVDKAIVSKGLTFGKPVHKLDEYVICLRDTTDKGLISSTATRKKRKLMRLLKSQLTLLGLLMMRLKLTLL